MAKNRHKGAAAKRENGGFVALPHAVIRSGEFALLSPFAVKALMDLLSQYRGDNNGDLCAAWTLMEKRAWRSRDSLAKGIKELLETSFLVVTRQGTSGRRARDAKKRMATLYGMTFYEIDWCSGKLDLQAPSRNHMGAWRRFPIVVTRPLVQSRQDCPAERVNAEAAA